MSYHLIRKYEICHFYYQEVTLRDKPHQTHFKDDKQKQQVFLANINLEFEIVVL